jgi:hypothetical protein
VVAAVQASLAMLAREDARGEGSSAWVVSAATGLGSEAVGEADYVCRSLRDRTLGFEGPS